MLGLLAMSFDLVIQKILGHRSIKTTELYTHISGGAKNKVGSPLDFLGQQKDLTSDPGGLEPQPPEPKSDILSN